MVSLNSYSEMSYGDILLDEKWNDSKDVELKMHSIHAYPAKFPAFMAKKAFDYARDEGVKISSVADIFCGCGTVALESRKQNYNFWGCDINPVATLIAKVKSSDYDIKILNNYFDKIENSYKNCILPKDLFEKANKRLKYWFSENSYCLLWKIYQAIDKEVDEEKYREAFKCLFSSILKASSRWLTKSIKPQIDPNKSEIDIWKRFECQYDKFIKAVDEIEPHHVSTQISCGNFLDLENIPTVDLIVTSPPYVTSYEYADLHQLSALWLDYAIDYRELRNGSIGSRYISDKFSLDEIKLNSTGFSIVQALYDRDKSKSRVISVARYFSDMQKVIEKCSTFLKPEGMVFFVVGDTEYMGVKIQNAKHLVEALFDNKYEDVKISKRTVSKGICVPFRDESGKFTKKTPDKKIYHEEFIISGRKAK